MGAMGKNERERERERERESERVRESVCVCVRESERERESECVVVSPLFFVCAWMTHTVYQGEDSYGKAPASHLTSGFCHRRQSCC